MLNHKSIERFRREWAIYTGTVDIEAESSWMPYPAPIKGRWADRYIYDETKRRIVYYVPYGTLTCSREYLI